MENDDVPLESEAFIPRGYQLEMLDASLKGNTIVAMDTGSGKTPIAVMRIAVELEQSPSKRVWFLCPKVALAQQQHRVIQRQLPAVLCKVIVGSDGCEYWSTQAIWDKVLLNVQVVVCTPEILYDALCHGFVSITGISLLIFDEAHHCKDKHPANRILSYFYHPARQNGGEIPHVLGLTASPVFGNKVSALEIIESNLNSVCRTPRLNREELLQHTHCPTLVQVSFEEAKLFKPQVLLDLEQLYYTQSIYDDPWIKSLQADEDVSQEDVRKAVLKGKTSCRDQIRMLIETATKVFTELGSWAAEWYVLYCVNAFRSRRSEALLYSDSLQQEELNYLLLFFDKLDCLQKSTAGPPDFQNVSPKVKSLMDILLQELRSSQALNTTLTTILFVETRAAVCVLKQLLEHSPLLEDLRLGLSFGTSTNSSRKTMICDSVTRDKSIEDIEIVLDDLRVGKKNLLVSTNVVEEGIDITVCNTIICFDQPPNLVSFVQRRGRARDSRSKYFIMFPTKQVASGVSRWIELEAQMKLKYMDHMRELIRLEELEASQNAERTYRVESTGAQLQLCDTPQHLNHFCSTLGGVRYASMTPVFVFHPNKKKDLFMCQVTLPNSVDNQFRSFRSSKYWPTERLAKNDAAFECCVSLHQHGLLNDNLLPMKSLSEEEESMYQVLEKRPNVVEVLAEFDPWPKITKLSGKPDNFLQQDVIIYEGNDVRLRMRLIMPGMPKSIQRFNLYIDESTTYAVSFQNIKPIDAATVEQARRFTKSILYSIFRSRMNINQDLLPVFFLPETEFPKLRLDDDIGDLVCNKMHRDDLERENIGLVRDVNYAPYIFLGFENVEMANEQFPGGTTIAKRMIRATKMSKRTDFLHALSSGSQPKQETHIYLDPETTGLDTLPAKFSQFASFIPCIQHKIRNSLLVEHFQETVLKSAAFSSANTVLEAISAPMAREPVNYQRLEFLGDAVLKYYTAVTLMARNLNYPEGYLAYMKDLVVSNKSAALAAKEVGLDEFIIRTGFTGTKWRPTYVHETSSPPSPRSQGISSELSTKVLADVVEALIGAAYIDETETESKVLAVLDKFTCRAVRSKIEWQPLAIHNKILFHATQELKQIPDLVLHLQRMIRYTFKHPSLAVEALTHPSHISMPSKVQSGSANYQRLEFLGDAVLDMVVTRAIYAFKKPTSVFRMHLLRTAAVNQDILGYLALRLKVDVDTTRLVKNMKSAGQKRDRYSNSRNEPSRLPEAYIQSISLPQLLRHAPASKLSADLMDMQRRCHELDDNLKQALENGQVYPWVTLAELAPEKLASDLIESVIGAMYIDSHGDLDVCEAWIERLGILPWLRRALENDIRVWHPKEELGVLADIEKVEYSLKRNPEQEVTFTCTVSVGGRQTCEAQGLSRKIAETKAAALAVEILRKDTTRSFREPGAILDLREEVRTIDLEE